MYEHRRAPDHEKRRAIMWVAVGVTMVAIIAIWVVVLPLQMDKNGQGLFGDPAIAKSGERARQTFEESLNRLDASWKDIFARQAAAEETQNAAKAVDGLKSKIEDAANKPPATKQP